jgi:hypothetical protein
MYDNLKKKLLRFSHSIPKAVEGINVFFLKEKKRERNKKFNILFALRFLRFLLEIIN